MVKIDNAIASPANCKPSTRRVACFLKIFHLYIDFVIIGVKLAPECEILAKIPQMSMVIGRITRQKIANTRGNLIYISKYIKILQKSYWMSC